jgi:hypothetical protein
MNNTLVALILIIALPAIAAGENDPVSTPNPDSAATSKTDSVKTPAKEPTNSGDDSPVIKKWPSDGDKQWQLEQLKKEKKLRRYVMAPPVPSGNDPLSALCRLSSISRQSFQNHARPNNLASFFMLITAIY